jgi:Txe/YoeB family toxin of Txe-Axe toxin-antitoxin module
MNLSEDDIRAMVREMLAGGIQEYDALYSKEKAWKQESKELRTLLVDLLKNIENDDYKEGVSKIDTVVHKLQTWKRKIEKFID